MEYSFILDNQLFRGIDKMKAQQFLSEAGCRQVNFSPGQMIYMAGDRINSIGIVMSGQVVVESADERGNRVIFSTVEPSGHFGDAYAVTGMPLTNNVMAAEDSQVMFIQMDKLREGKTGSVASQIRGNLVEILAQKNMVLSRKIRVTSRKTIRQRIMVFLKDESILQGSDQFQISFDRQSLADYLNCDRSQLSKELSRMQEEGLIQYRKNYFKMFFSLW